MKRKKEFNVVIQFDLHRDLKEKLERYCERKGLTMAETLRCFILNLPEEEERKENGR